MQTVLEKNSLRTEISSADYRLSIFPPASIISQLESLTASYGDKSYDSTFEIVLATFNLKDCVEKTMLRLFENLMRSHHSFELTLNNFGGDPQGSIFLRLMDQQKLAIFLHSFLGLDEFMRSNGCDLIHYYGNQPLYLWKKLSEDVFLDMMLLLSKQTFHESFTVDTLYLFKYDHTENKNRLVQIFKLRDQAISHN